MRSCGAGGKQWAIGIWRCRRQTVCIWIKAQDSKKISCDDPFQTVPGSIPGSCIPAFTGTQRSVRLARTTITSTPRSVNDVEMRSISNLLGGLLPVRAMECQLFM